MLCYLSEQMVTRVAAIDAVVAVGVDVHLEVLVCLHQSLSIFKCVLRMYVVISQTVTYQQRALQVARTIHRIDVITSWILLWRAHITFCVNGVIETPVCRRCHSNT